MKSCEHRVLMTNLFLKNKLGEDVYQKIIEVNKNGFNKKLILEILGE